MSKIIARNIKKLRKDYNLSQKELAEIAGVSDKAVSTWENEIKEPRMGVIQKIADHFGILKSSIIEEDGLINYSTNRNYAAEFNIREESVRYNANQTKMTVYGKICAGNGKLAYEDILDEIICPYPHAKGEMIALQVDGESMNKVIPNGVYSIIKMQPTVENGQICAVTIEQEKAMLKRFYRLDDDTVVLKPESNEDFKPLMFVGDEINSIKIIGKYIGFVSPYAE